MKIDKTITSSSRLAINSTVCVLGLFDVATSLGIQREREDFGQTLGFYGISSGPYLVLPFFGPSSFRDAPGFYADVMMEKVFHQFIQSYTTKKDKQYRQQMS